MIVDFVLGVVHGMATFVVGILPEGLSLGTWGEHYAGYSDVVRNLLSAANYFLPVVELMRALAVFFGLYAAVILYRFVWRLIPGLG